MTITNTLSNRRFGIEIEALGCSRSTVAAAMNAAGIPCFDAGYTHAVSARWKVVSDASLGSDGFELVSPILQGADGLAQIEKVCAVLNALGARVDRSCGLHVHVDGTDFARNVTAVKNMARLFLKYETCFDQVVAKSRRDGNSMLKSLVKQHHSLESAFSKIAASTSVRQVMQAVTGFNDEAYGRYFKLNLFALGRHGTIEFRQHQGTTDATKITNWVRFVTDFADQAYDARCIDIRGNGDFTRFARNAKSADIRAYLKSRRATLVGSTT